MLKLPAEKEGVVSVFPNTIQKLQTTRSWDFLGLSDEIGKTKRNPKVESNLIIGVLDTGNYLQFWIMMEFMIILSTCKN